jgi:hypothetical protein
MRRILSLPGLVVADWASCLAWFSLRSLVLRVGDRPVYAEGAGRWSAKQSELLSTWDELA